MKIHAALLLAAALLIPLRGHAAPADYVFLPAVEYGEKEINFKMGTARKGGDPRSSAASIGYGYGAKPWWFTELYLKGARENNGSSKYDALEWENKFQLTETGKYPVDVGFLLEVERPGAHSEGWEAKWGPLFQTEFGKIQLNANMLFERHYRTTALSQTELLYQWQAKYRWLREFEFGLQGFGEMGKWDHWSGADNRTDRLGPAVFGKLPLGERRAIRYNAAWLIGAAKASPEHTFRMQVEYEF
jgi:hypothetical protein